MVESATRELRLLVDIEANDGYGQCGCEQHAFRAQPLLDQGGPPPPRCRHIVAAREAFTDDMIQRIRCKTQAPGN